MLFRIEDFSNFATFGAATSFKEHWPNRVFMGFVSVLKYIFRYAGDVDSYGTRLVQYVSVIVTVRYNR